MRWRCCAAVLPAIACAQGREPGENAYAPPDPFLFLLAVAVFELALAPSQTQAIRKIPLPACHLIRKTPCQINRKTTLPLIPSSPDPRRSSRCAPAASPAAQPAPAARTAAASTPGSPALAPASTGARTPTPAAQDAAAGSASPASSLNSRARARSIIRASCSTAARRFSCSRMAPPQGSHQRTQAAQVRHADAHALGALRRRLQRGPSSGEGAPTTVGQLNEQPELAAGTPPAGHDLERPAVERVPPAAKSRLLRTRIVEWGSLKRL